MRTPTASGCAPRPPAEPYLEGLDPSGRRAAARVLARAEDTADVPASTRRPPHPTHLCRAYLHAVRLTADAAWMSRHVRSPLIFGEFKRIDEPIAKITILCRDSPTGPTETRCE